MWKRFYKLENGVVASVIESEADEVEGFTPDPDKLAQVGADYDEATGVYGKPHPDARRLLKALVLIIKANADKITIPPAALEIWQEIKDNRL